MARFPKLKTGAPTQYPAIASMESPTHVTRFVDGGTQRFRMRAGVIRRWELDLALLDESETRMLENFFVEQRGAAGTFEFEDPQSAVVYGNCRFEHDQLELEASEVFQNRGKLRVRTV